MSTSDVEEELVFVDAAHPMTEDELAREWQQITDQLIHGRAHTPISFLQTNDNDDLDGDGL